MTLGALFLAVQHYKVLKRCPVVARYIYLPCTASSRSSRCGGFVWISCRRGRRLASLSRGARRIFPLEAPEVAPLMTAGEEVPCLCAPYSLFCWHDDRCHIHKRHSALQWRRRSPGLHRRRRRRLASGPRSALLLPRPCRNRYLDPAGSAAVASCTSATDPLRRAWHKQPSVITKQATLHHYNTSISCSLADRLLSLRAWAVAFLPTSHRCT